MNIALFATGRVGHDVVKVFADRNETLCCLVLDSRDPNGHESMIQDARTICTNIIYSDNIYEDRVVAELKKMELDLIILAWWPYILRNTLIELPALGCLNFHPSYLPYNRGKHYNFWSIVEDTPFGVTLHFIDERIDSGDIAYQSVIEKSWEDTGETLYAKAQSEIVRLFSERFDEIKSGKIPRIPQDLSQGTSHRSAELEEASKIDLDRTYRAGELLNLLRARTFRPYPAAWFTHNGAKYEVRVEIKRVK